MRPLAASALLAFSAVLAPACGYPDFTFEGVDAGVVERRVPCGMDGALCDVGEVCCFDRASPPTDVCAEPSKCPSQHSEFSCNVTRVCPDMLVCCAQFGASMLPDVIECRKDCPAPGELACETDDDCSSGTCQAMLDGYPGYRLCTN